MGKEQSIESSVFEKLEPRILLSGSPMPETDDSAVHIDLDSDPQIEEHHVSEILFVDANVENMDSFFDEFDRSVEVVLLPEAQDGLEYITSILQERQGISAIHILSHGNSGEINLGNAVLNESSLEQYRSSLEQWGASLTSDADILIYGCNFGQAEGLLNEISSLTNADIAASDDLTGAEALGGDAELEVEIGQIETEEAFSQAQFNQAKIVLLDAVNDDYSGSDPTSENSILNIAAVNGILQNDDTTNASIASSSAVSANGAAVTINSDGSFTYDPTSSSTLQALDEGDSIVDTFEYTLVDNATAPDGLMNVQYLHTSGTNPGNNSDNWQALWDEVAGTNTTGNVVTSQGTYNVVYNNSDTDTVFDYNSGGDFSTNRDIDSINSDGPGGGSASTNNSNYSIRVNSFLKFETAGTYTIAMGSDDGRRIELKEASVGSAPGYTGFTSRGDQNNGSFSSGDTVIGYSGNTGHNQTVGTFTVDAGDILELTAFYYEGGGGDSGEISIASGSFSSFTNTSDFTLLANGVKNIFVASDFAQLNQAITQETATVSITVNGVNDAPVARNDSSSITELKDDTVTVNTVNGNFFTNGADDRDADDSISDFSITQISNSTSGTDTSGTIVGQYGTLTWTPNTQGTGTYTYTLDDSNATVQALNSGNILKETFTYTLSDNHSNGNVKTDTAVLTITINGVNDSLLAESNIASVTEDSGANQVASGNLISDDDSVDTNHPDGVTVDVEVDGVDLDIISVNHSTSGTDTSGTIAGDYGTLVWNAETGAYTYTLNNGTDGASSIIQDLTAGEQVTDVFTYMLHNGYVSGDGQMNIQYLSTSGSTPGNNTANWQALWEEVWGTNTTGNVATSQGTYNVTNNNSDTENVFDYDSGGNFSTNTDLETINSDGPGGGDSTVSDENYSIRTRSFLAFNEAGTYTISMGSDDGRRIELKEASVGSAPGFSGFTARGDQTNGSFTPGDTVIGYSGGTGHNQTVGTFTVAAGDILELDAFYYQGGGGHSGEISIAKGEYSSYTNNTDFNLLTDELFGIAVSSTNNFSLASVGYSNTETDTATLTVTINGENDLPVVETVSSTNVNNLNGWGVDHNQPTGVNTENPNWNVSGTSVSQPENSHPSVFYSDFEINTDKYKGEFKISSTSGDDNDFYGFVLGYTPGGITNDADGFILIDWNRVSENHHQMGQSHAGLAASFVQGTNIEGRDYWTHTGDVTEVERATNLGSTGFTLGTEYTIRYEIDGTSLKIYVDDVLELDLTAADFGLSEFPDGRFGFYNFAQENSHYEYINIQSYTENADPLVISPDLSISDIDSPIFSGGTLTVSVTNNGVPAEDVLGTGVLNYAAFATLDGTSTNSQLIFNLNAGATLANVQALARAVTYANSSDNPDTSTRTVSFTFNDGDGGNVTKDFDILIEAVNDAPVITLATDSFSLDEGTSVNITGISLADVDANAVDLQLTLSVVSGSLNITDPDAGPVSGGNLVINGALSELNTALSTLSYTADPDYSGTVLLNIDFSDLGGSGTGGTLTDSKNLTIYVDPVIDVSVPGNISTTEDQSVNFSVSATDVSENLTEVTFTNVDGTISGNGITDLGGGSYRWNATGTTPSVLDFSALTVNSHGAQDIDESFNVSADGKTLNLTGNTWRNIDFNYTVTADTILEFEFKSDVEPELSMITFDNDNEWSSATPFIKLHGVQNYLDSVNGDYTNYDGSGEWVKYKIPVGTYFTGSFTKLAFANDDDRSGSPGDSSFRNVVVYESDPNSSLTFSYNPTQDLEVDTNFDVQVKTFDSGTVNVQGPQQVNVDITPVNDNPFISKVGADTDAAAFTETDSVNLTASGTLSVEDVDFNDVVTYSVSSVTATGITAGLNSSYTKLLSMMSVSGSIGNMTTTGVLAWDFDSGNEAFNYLSDGEVLTLTYTVRATDNSGILTSFDTHDITINVTGTNDRPLALHRSTEVSEDEKLTIKNIFLKANELDYSQDLRAENISVDMTGPMDEEFDYDLNAEDGVLTFDPHQFNYLKEGEVLKLVFNFTLVDDSGFGNGTLPNEADNVQETFTLFIIGNREASPNIVAVNEPAVKKAYESFIETSQKETEGSTLRASFVTPEKNSNSLTFVAGTSRLQFEVTPISEAPLNVIPQIFNENVEPQNSEVAETSNYEIFIKDKSVYDLPKLSEGDLKLIEDLVSEGEETELEEEKEDEFSYRTEDDSLKSVKEKERPRYRPITQYDLDLEINLSETLVGDFDCTNSTTES